LLGVSRETIRQRLRDAGGVAGLCAWAVEHKLASQADADAWALQDALASANRQGANLATTANHSRDAKSHDFKGLTGDESGRILSSDMSAVPVAMNQRSSVKVDGSDREFAKRVALEVALRMGLPREDMSEVVSRMIAFFRRQGDPARVAQMLIDSEHCERRRGEDRRSEQDEGGGSE